MTAPVDLRAVLGFGFIWKQMPSLSDSDDDLIGRARDGEMHALDALVRRHQSWVFNFALRMI